MIKRIFDANIQTNGKTNTTTRTSTRPIWIKSPPIPHALYNKEVLYKEEIYVGSPESGEQPPCPLDNPHFGCIPKK